jgi:hypothetical protein
VILTTLCLVGAKKTDILVPGRCGGGCLGRFLELSCLAMLYFVAKSSDVGANLDGLACSLHRPTVYSCQRGGQSFLTGAFQRDAKPLGPDI